MIKIESMDEIVKEDASLPPIVDIKDTELSESNNSSLYGTFFGIDVYEVGNDLLTYRDQETFRTLVWEMIDMKSFKELAHEIVTKVDEDAPANAVSKPKKANVALPPTHEPV